MTGGGSCSVITAYYELPAKHSHANYRTWMKNMLPHIDQYMVIFTDQEHADMIREMRAPYMYKTLIWVLPMTEWFFWQDSIVRVWKKHHTIDYERKIHSPELYAVWSEKTMFVNRVIEKNPFGTESFCWCDIGCFRDAGKTYKMWPSQRFLEGADKNKMVFLEVEPFCGNELEILGNRLTRPFDGKGRIGGTIFFGYKDTFLTYINLYYKYFTMYVAEGYFAGKDQNIICTMYATHPELFQLVRPVAGEGDPWFYLQRFFN